MNKDVIHGQYPQRRPNTVTRGISSMVMGMTASISKVFLNGFNSLETIGLDNFVKLLEEREDPYDRQRGLITVSNHISVMDDPLIWGVLPFSVAFYPTNLRWSLGAHDICFKNKLLGAFFNLGQVLPTHRGLHSDHAGIFQPVMTQAIRLLSAYPFKALPDHVNVPVTKEITIQSLLADLRDPFTEGGLTYSTTGKDLHVAPSAFLSNRHAWVHVFPEGLVHQHPQRQMRYFKWGVARMILEAEPMPDLVPMFIDGTIDVMNENREWPRYVPRAGNNIKVVFGDRVDMESTFGDLRRQWKRLMRGAVEQRQAEIAAVEEQHKRLLDAAAVSQKTAAADRQAWRHGIVSAKSTPPVPLKKPDVWRIGDLPDDLKYSKEAEEIRIEVARRVRNEVLKVRKSLGYPDEDPALHLDRAETWARDPKQTKQSPVDGSAEKPST